MSAHRDELGQAFVNRDGEYNAYSPYKGIWHLSKGGYTFAKIEVKTICEKREDYSGMKKYRLIRRQELTLSVRVYTSIWYTVKESLIFHDGEVAAIKKILEWGEDWAYKQARYSVDVEYRDVVSQARQTQIWWDNYDNNEAYVYKMIKAAQDSL